MTCRKIKIDPLILLNLIFYAVLTAREQGNEITKPFKAFPVETS